MLSEKAKGKRRAVEIDPPSDVGPSGSGTNELHEEPTKRQLVIRFAEGAPDLTVSVGKQDTVRDIKRKVRILRIDIHKCTSLRITYLYIQIRDVRPELKDRRIRLIHLGRLLTDGTFLYSWLASLEEKQKRAAAANVEDEEGSSKPAALKPTTTWIQCSVGPSLEPGEEVEEGDEGKQVRFASLLIRGK